MERIYTVTVKEKNGISTNETHIKASSEQEAKKIVESRGAKVIKIQFGKI
jgi:hypothetical protein